MGLSVAFAGEGFFPGQAVALPVQLGGEPVPAEMTRGEHTHPPTALVTHDGVLVAVDDTEEAVPGGSCTDLIDAGLQRLVLPLAVTVIRAQLGDGRVAWTRTAGHPAWGVIPGSSSPHPALT